MAAIHFRMKPNKALTGLSKDEIENLISDIEAAKTKQKRLRQMLKDAGIEPKD